MTTAADINRSAALPLKCGACNRPMESSLFCESCRALHDPDQADHFLLLGVAPSYDLDPDELRRKYLRLSRDIHPDRFGSGADAAAAVRASARANEALRVLTDPVLRAEYMLEVAGGPSAAADKSVPQELLTWALLVREEMEEARAGRDATALDALRRQVQSRRDAALLQAAAAARQLPGHEALRRDLRSGLNALRYYDRILEQSGPA
ncbi:Co-chaperone protein HscB [Phycisphaerae bacterium RAS1]|nr:Co-chaperone protein HscB [Phycisphaerae bacterium RAS1]